MRLRGRVSFTIQDAVCSPRKMDIIVKFPDGHEMTLKLSSDARILDVLITLVSSLGITSSCDDFVRNWGVTLPQEDQWLNIHWLDISLPLSMLSCSTHLIFGKKIFTKTDELGLLTMAPILRHILYHQLLQIYLCGMLYCVAHKAAKLSALAAYIEVSKNDYLTAGTKWLKSYLPPRLLHYTTLLPLIAKHMQKVGHRPIAVVQTAFIKGIMKLDNFGISYYSSNIDTHEGVFAIAKSRLIWMDKITYEPQEQWPIECLQRHTVTCSGVLMSFNGDEVMLETAYGLEISQYLTEITGIPAKQKLVECYTLEAGGDDESYNGIEVIAVRNQSSCFDSIPRKHDRSNISPILRNGEHRKGFRQRKEVTRIQHEPLTIEDSVEELSRIMNTDFGSGEAEWTHETDSPVYDRVASARVDSTLKLSRLTYTSLSQTLKWNRKAQKRKKKISFEDTHSINDSVTASPTKVSPPPLPPKPAKFTTSLTVRVTQQNITTNNDQEQDEPEEETDSPEHRQRLGTYILEAHQNQSAAGQKSRPVQPGEALKDYATLRREFRIFCVKLPNGQVHWELASLYQPIQKLIARLCILIHAEEPTKYQLTVEGYVLSQLKETGTQENNTDDLQTSSSRDVTPSPLNYLENGREMEPLIITPKHFLNLPTQSNDNIILDPKQTFKDQGITTSRILHLRSQANHYERLPLIPIKVPDWVKFHQCWLSVVHGNHPCSLQDAVTLAAVLYQCYVLDRTEINSVIGFCNVVDFLPPEYATIKGIEERVLKERENLLLYSRQQLEQIYIQGVSTSPLFNTAFFPCKEPRRQFLSNSKMIPILLGINREGVVRVDIKSRQILDVWTYELFRNWGYSRNSFLLAFDSSTYPVKTNQGKWMTELINLHVNCILQTKGLIKQEESSDFNSLSLQSDNASHHPYFLLEADPQLEHLQQPHQERHRPKKPPRPERMHQPEIASPGKPNQREESADPRLQQPERPSRQERLHQQEPLHSGRPQQLEHPQPDILHQLEPLQPERPPHLNRSQLKRQPHSPQPERTEESSQLERNHQPGTFSSHPVLERNTSHYFVLEKVYEELLRVRSTSPDKVPPIPKPRQINVDSLYVNPHPNCSLINPDEPMVQRMHKLGLLPQNSTDIDPDYDEVASDPPSPPLTDSSIEWDVDSTEDETTKDDYFNDPIISQKRHGQNRPLPILIEHIYDVPPD